MVVHVFIIENATTICLIVLVFWFLSWLEEYRRFWLEPIYQCYTLIYRVFRCYSKANIIHNFPLLINDIFLERN